MGSLPNLPPNSEIHVEKLENLPSLLSDLQQYVEKGCVAQMTAIATHLSGSGIKMTDVDMKLHQQATPFGGFYSAFGVAAKAQAAHDSVNTTLKDLARALGKMVEPTRQIAQNYRDTEDRNRASMEDIQKLLGEGKYTPFDQDSQDAMDGRNTVDPTATWAPPPKTPKK